MNGFRPHLPWLYRQFLHFQRLKGVIWRNYSGIKISHQAKQDFMFLRLLFLQFPVCRWDRGCERELKCLGDICYWEQQAPLPCPKLSSQWTLEGDRLPTCFFFFFLINLFIYLFIYLFLAVLGLRFCERALSSCGERGPLFIAVRGPLTVAASLVAEHRLQTRRLSSCGTRA